MKAFVFLCFIMSLVSCADVDQWLSQWSEFATTSIASSVSNDNFSPSQQEDLDILFDEIYFSTSCRSLEGDLINNNTITILEETRNLPTGALYTGLSSFNLKDAFTKIYAAKEQNLSLSVVLSWKQTNTNAEINQALNKIRNCHFQRYSF